MKNHELSPSKSEQLSFLRFYGIDIVDNWEDSVITSLYKTVKKIIPRWADWLIRKTGCKEFIFMVIGVEIYSGRHRDDYIIVANDKKSKFKMCSGIYVPER